MANFSRFDLGQCNLCYCFPAAPYIFIKLFLFVSRTDEDTSKFYKNRLYKYKYPDKETHDDDYMEHVSDQKKKEIKELVKNHNKYMDALAIGDKHLLKF